MCYISGRTGRLDSAGVFSMSFLTDSSIHGIFTGPPSVSWLGGPGRPTGRARGGRAGRGRPACCSRSACQGRCHCWLVPSPQDQIWTWVPEPPKPVSSRHLPDSGLTSSPLDWACHCCAPVPLQVYRSTRVPLAVPAPSTSRHMPSTSRVPLDSTVHCWALVPLQV